MYRSFGQAWLSRRQRLSTRQLSQILDFETAASLCERNDPPFPGIYKMNTRTKHTIVRFTAPFSLSGVDEIQPPGDYAIDEDEELIDGLSWLAYRRVATFIHIPAISSTDRLRSQLVGIDHSELKPRSARMRNRRFAPARGSSNERSSLRHWAIGPTERDNKHGAPDRRHVQDHRENACKGLVASISDQQRRGTARARCGGKQSRRGHRCCLSKAPVG